MKKLFSSFFRRFTKNLEEDKIIHQIAELGRLTKSIEEKCQKILNHPEEILKPTPSVHVDKKENQEVSNFSQETPKEKEISPTQVEKSIQKTSKKHQKKASISFDQRDIMESMGIPFLSLSKNRKDPIVYESQDGTTKVRISCHSEHYIASIYDWDIIQCIAGKIQDLINSKKDIPSRALIIPRHELFKGIHKQDGKKQHKDLEESLNRLQTTLIDTTVRNEDYRYRSGFSFLDNWKYTERKDIKEFKITLSEWLYDGICKNGALLKVHQEYFDMTSGLQKVLYRIARKHVGVQNTSWDFSIQDIHKKSGSEQELKKFKYDLKKAINGQKIPGYNFEFIEENGKIIIRIINIRKYCKEALKQPILPAPTQL